MARRWRCSGCYSSLLLGVQARMLTAALLDIHHHGDEEDGEQVQHVPWVPRRDLACIMMGLPIIGYLSGQVEACT